MYDPLLTIGTVIFEAANFVYTGKRFEFEGAAWGGGGNWGGLGFTIMQPNCLPRMEGEELADDPIMHMHKDLCMGSSRIDPFPL